MFAVIILFLRVLLFLSLFQWTWQAPTFQVMYQQEAKSLPRKYSLFQRNSTHFHLYQRNAETYLLCHREQSIPIRQNAKVAIPPQKPSRDLVNGTSLSVSCLKSVQTAKVGIVSYVYNESDILPYWLQYHTKIFGIHQVAIIDDGSPKETQIILRNWEKKGLTVIHNRDEYANKGNTTLSAFQTYFPEVDFLVPLDADELLVALDDNGVPLFSKNRILENFQKFLTKYTISNFRYRRIYVNCNRSPSETILTANTFQLAPEKWIKRFYRNFHLTELDHGNHHGHGGRSNESYHLGLLHYHNRNLDLKLQRALRDLEAFHYIPAMEGSETNNRAIATLVNQTFLQEIVKVKGKGNHKATELLNYLRHGREALMEKCMENNSFTLPYVKEMIEMVPESSLRKC
jgi:hypothetical protein